MAPALTTLGLTHTLLSLAAIGCALASLAAWRRLGVDTRLGQAYLALTALTAVTALGLHQRGAFGPGHVLALLALAAVAAAWATAHRRSRAAARVHDAALLTTALCHAVPGVTEALTRLPPGAPVVATPESPAIVGLSGAMLLAWLALVIIRTRRIRASA